jgi:hypothetical protein
VGTCPESASAAPAQPAPAQLAENVQRISVVARGNGNGVKEGPRPVLVG